MGDFKQEFEKKGIKGSGDNMKKCSKCGKPIEDKFSTCLKCSQTVSSSSYGGGASSSVMPKDYLKDGYFDKNGCIHETLLTTTADEIAELFSKSSPKLETHQLRRFFNHVRAAANRLNMTDDWSCVKGDISKLSSFAAYGVGKKNGRIPQEFYKFIEENVKRTESEKSLTKGFVEHFQAVVAYFTYHTKDRR
ncbi:type III-A CRISPR-associated protein Csm2 [Candidatus Magnetominusculus xianensis]|uniref:CRISPR system Cms protein Csm2 n=1 Tax=Candidatus Magnetominusculus xianensis TaxID=1748249 RepID=A0ABR5SJR5_9BACT|nr:type III-A CRISPR-associated protein Csm2 [Candidatus Magnetominusculus xianensis]KWT94953.1 CRISPR-associated protein Csm2 [Candidatus Magnetominusculus xianensis]MBF0405199.1 type III-A CRISPR-associated protein Csm2 [Nitrospirota bacterium]